MAAEKKAMAEHKAQPIAPVTGERGTVSSSSRAARPGGPRLAPGTIVKVVTTQSLSTRSAVTGQEWTGTLSEDLKDSAGKVLAKAGSNILGRVVLVSDGSNIRRKHELEVRIHRLELGRGQSVDIRTSSLIRTGPEAGRRPAVIESGMPMEFQLVAEAVFP